MQLRWLRLMNEILLRERLAMHILDIIRAYHRGTRNDPRLEWYNIQDGRDPLNWFLPKSDPGDRLGDDDSLLQGFRITSLPGMETMSCLSRWQAEMFFEPNQMCYQEVMGRWQAKMFLDTEAVPRAVRVAFGISSILAWVLEVE